MSSMADVRLGVPGLGFVDEVYDWACPASLEAWDKNVANGCVVIWIRPWREDPFYWGA